MSTGWPDAPLFGGTPPAANVAELLRLLESRAELGPAAAFDRLAAAASVMLTRIEARGDISREDAEAALEFSGALVTLKIALERAYAPPPPGG